jgi:hypothetical protein
MAEQDQKGQQKILPGFSFMTPSLQQNNKPSVSQGSWQMSKLQKTMSIGSTDGILKRDGTDAFQSIQDKEKLEKEAKWESEEDAFEDVEEKNALLEEALRERIEIPFPPVYTQIMTLCEHMVNGKKTLKPIPFYLDELNNHIQKHIKFFSSLSKVNNENMTRSNELMINGLSLLEEACNGLRRYTDDNSPFHIQLVRQLLNQANEFFLEGKNLLLSVKVGSN